MHKTKAIKCSLCGNETFQGAMCAVCKAGITQLHQELITLLKEGKNLNVLKKVNLPKRYRNISLN